MVVTADTRTRYLDTAIVLPDEGDLFDKFIARLEEYIDPAYVREHVGNGESDGDRARAVDILYKGGIVGMFIGGKVGGLLASPFCKGAVDNVIDIKSRGGADRHPLFPLVAQVQTIRPFIQEAHLGRYRLEELAGRGFFQYFATDQSLKTFEPRFFSQYGNGESIIQFFIPEEGSLLEQLLDETGEQLPVPALLGTSANFTGEGSIKNPDTAALFGLATQVYWLYGHEDSLPVGSYPIQRFSEGELIQVR